VEHRSGRGTADAYAELERFADRYGRVPLLLLMHAAVPQSFRPDLLNLIKVNFVFEAGDDVTVDADVLFSPLVESTPPDFYRLDEEVRRQCLILLDAAYKHAEERRSVTVARFVLAYANRAARSPEAGGDPMLRDHLMVQAWVAGAFLDPRAVAGQFARALQGPDAAVPAARVRMSGLASALTMPLTGFPELIAYAKGLGALAVGNRSLAEGLLDRFVGRGLEIEDVRLRLPPDYLRQRLRPVQQPVGRPQPSPPPPPPPRDESEPIQIYISYARADDELPPEAPDRAGFVTSLRDQLLFEFNRLGHPRPKIWKGPSSTLNTVGFTPEIRQALAESSLLLVILSRNWLSSESCGRELLAFAGRWESDPSLRERIFVAEKRHVPDDLRPPLLQHRAGFSFLQFDDPADPGSEMEYYSRGRARDPRFYDVIKELARVLWRKSERLLRIPRAAAASAARQGPNAQIVYVAKVASDMSNAYDRLVRELLGRGYQVVPDVGAEIPHDSSATAFIDEALASASMSVHLLGERHGYAPENADPIVQLQLKRAARMCPAGALTSSAEHGFRRVIWAPERLDYIELTRDPIAVLAKFDNLLGSDAVTGGSLTEFVDLALRSAATRVAQAAAAPTKPRSSVYICCGAEGQAYASALAEALTESDLVVFRPAFDGPPAEVIEINRKQLQVCDIAAVCWSWESEIWVRSTLQQLRDWHGLGRAARFAWLWLIVGPPLGPGKSAMMASRPAAFENVLDLTQVETPSMENVASVAASIDS
jgi:hypothetical protein